MVHGKRVPYFAERDMDDMQHGTTLRDIMSGEVEHVAKVFCWDDEAHTMTDVSDEFAAEMLAEAEYPLARHVVDFAEEHLGVRAVADAVREAVAA